MASSILASLISSLRAYMRTPRILIALVIMALIIWNNVTPLYAFSDVVGYRINPMLLAFIVNDPVNQLMLMIGSIIMLADAPFANSNQILVMLRSGRIPWIIGKIIFMAIMSIMYWAAANMMVLLFLLPCATFATDGWGSVISTLAETDAAAQFDIAFPIDSYIVQTMSPQEATLMATAMEILATFALGLVIMIVNLATSTKVGLGVSIFWVLLDLLIVNLLPYSMYLFSIASHARLMIFTERSLSMPALEQTALFDVLAIIILVAVSIVLFCKKDVFVQDDL